MTHAISLGATPHVEGGWQFLVWAPRCQTVAVNLLKSGTLIPMTAQDDGYFYAVARDAKAGDRYFFRLNDADDRPDPTSRAQPDGVHGPSQLVDPHFDWKSPGAPFAFTPPALRDMVIYELHVGTFTPEGTFEAVIPHLARLRELGINAIELMPVAHFPGERNWGYDGVDLFAAHTAYGGVTGLKTLVDAAHQVGMAVIQDVVYNHFGPEGNYLHGYGDYFTDHYRTPWGDAINLDGKGSAHVRRFLIENALYWLNECRMDGLRLDATQELYDATPTHFLQELTSTIDAWEDRAQRRVHIIAESNRSDRRKITPADRNGLGLDAVYLDDMHHVLHYAITGEAMSYLAPFANVGHLSKIMTRGFLHSGEFSPVHQRVHGSYSDDLPSYRFLVSTQNHDYTGNRAEGDRLSHLTDLSGLKVAAAFNLLSPYLPMLFMGEEVPDPASPATFGKSTLNHDLRQDGQHALLYRYYGALLELRRNLRAITNPNRRDFQTGYIDSARTLWLLRSEPGQQTVLTVWNLHQTVTATLTPPDGPWRKVFDSAAPEWVLTPADAAPSPDVLTTGASLTLHPKSCVVYVRNAESSSAR
jgi:maltooligosyltrehalose trehalohydrolase